LVTQMLASISIMLSCIFEPSVPAAAPAIIIEKYGMYGTAV
jgi:hypothetical protein